MSGRECETEELWWRDASPGVRAWLDEQHARGYACMCIEWNVMPPWATVGRYAGGAPPPEDFPKRELSVAERDELLGTWPEQLRTPLSFPLAAVAALGWLVVDPREEVPR